MAPADSMSAGSQRRRCPQLGYETQQRCFAAQSDCAQFRVGTASPRVSQAGNVERSEVVVRRSDNG